MSKPDRHALALIDDPKFAVEKSQLAKLQESAIAQLSAVQQLETNAAKGAVLSGITLLRVKASMPHGHFRKWTAQAKWNAGSILTPGSRQRVASYYMALARTFLARAKVQKPALLALPGDQTALDLGDSHPARDLMVKLEKFVGDCSLGELLAKYDIKAKKALGGARKAGEKEEGAVLDPEEAEAQAQDEIGTAFLALENTLEQSLQFVRDETFHCGMEESHAKIGKTLRAARGGKTK